MSQDKALANFRAVAEDAGMKNLAARPGVYLMKDGEGDVLYVGKAKDLQKRLSSYCRDRGHSIKTAALLARVRQLETVVTATEKEALILEASLIKEHRPRYNVILRDDKNYPAIKVTVAEEWPRVVMTRRRIKDGSRYFGPFSSAPAMWETINYLNRVFPLRRCKNKELRPKDRPCLNYQLGRCLGPCAGKADRATYLENVQSVLLFLEGKNRELLAELEKKMNEAAARLDFETAARWRDSMRALRSTIEKQVIVAAHFNDLDCFGYVRRDLAVAMALLEVKGGILSGTRTFHWPEPFGSDPEILGQAMCRYYSPERPPPAEILLPFFPQDGAMIENWLGDIGGRTVRLSIPSRGYRRHLLDMAMTNARKFSEEREKKDESWERLGEWLVRELGLPARPDRIECLDISNLSGELAVGSLVAFQSGEKDPKRYRSFKIRTVVGADDYGMMAEVLHRRFAPAKLAGWGLPDLLLLDGGRGQLGVAIAALKEAGLEGRIALAAIAKDKDGSGDKIYRPGRKNPFLLDRGGPPLLYLMRVRDEAHRFGITFHRKLRSKALLRSALDSIAGVGPERRQALLRHFGSIKGLAEASVEELAAVKGIGPGLALQIWDCLHAEKKEEL